jgi:hypothetical protein
MDYAILKELSINQEENYRGLERLTPINFYEPNLFELYEWYSSEVGAGYIHNQQKAVALIKEYKKYGQNFELLRICQEYDKSDNEFLGIDVASCGGYSMLKSGLLSWINNLTSKEITGIIDVIVRYFKPKLNDNLLFFNKEDANLFAKVTNEIGNIKLIDKKEYGFVEPGYYYYPQYLYLVKIE